MSRWRLACLAGGTVGVVVAFGPQVERAAAASLTGHMVQHLLLTLVAAPLLVLGAPAARRLVNRAPRPRRWQPGPLAALGVYTSVTWGWHLPALYDAAAAQPAVHAGMHASLLGAALLLWWTVARPERHGVGILVVFATAVQHAGLASLLLFAPAPLYTQVTSLDDQRLAAVVMATPAKLVYAVAVAFLVFSWLSSMERRTA